MKYKPSAATYINACLRTLHNKVRGCLVGSCVWECHVCFSMLCAETVFDADQPLDVRWPNGYKAAVLPRAPPVKTERTIRFQSLFDVTSSVSVYGCPEL
eukprot:1775135-Amphidinium_carterae.1